MLWLHNKYFRLIMFIVVVGTTLYFLFLVRDVVFSFLFGGILAYFLYRPVLWIEKKGMKRIWAIIVVYIVVFLAAALLLWFTIPKLIR